MGKLLSDKTPQLNGTFMLVPNSEKITGTEEAPPIQMHWKVPMASVSGTQHIIFLFRGHDSVSMSTYCPALSLSPSPTRSLFLSLRLPLPLPLHLPLPLRLPLPLPLRLPPAPVFSLCHLLQSYAILTCSCHK